MIFKQNILSYYFLEYIFKVVNKPKSEKSFGLGSVEIFKGSAETETSPKPLCSAETEFSVAHYRKSSHFLQDLLLYRFPPYRVPQVSKDWREGHVCSVGHSLMIR